MTTRSNGNTHVSSTDVLIAMLSSDLRGSWGEAGCAIRSREHVDPAASSPLPAIGEAGEPEEPGR
jgi:hypothetical protein